MENSPRIDNASAIFLAREQGGCSRENFQSTIGTRRKEAAERVKGLSRVSAANLIEQKKRPWDGRVTGMNINRDLSPTILLLFAQTLDFRLSSSLDASAASV